METVAYFIAVALALVLSFTLGALGGYLYGVQTKRAHLKDLIELATAAGYQSGWVSGYQQGSAKTQSDTGGLFCTVCQKDIKKCACADLDDRLREIKDSGKWVLRWCADCNRHVERCACRSVAMVN